MIKVFVADQHPIIFEGLQSVFNRTSDIRVLDYAKSGKDTVCKLNSGEFDLVILEFTFSDTNGLDLIKRIRKANPMLPILFYCSRMEVPVAVRLLKSGASGLLKKEGKLEELIEAVRLTAKHIKFITPDLAGDILQQMDRKNKEFLHDELSDREYNVMLMISEGKMPMEIAGMLGLSAKTISTYRMRILKKMNMKTNAELIHYSIVHRLV